MTADVPADSWFDAEGLRRLQPVNAEFACLDADHQHPGRLHLRRMGALLVALAPFLLLLALR